MQRLISKHSIHSQALIGVFFWAVIFVVQSAPAHDLKGLEDPELQAAVEIWLQDNDADSLAVFARLASEGNIAARMLLARIEVTDQAPGDYVDGLSRKARVELFRSNSGTGLFRPTWLSSEKKAGNEFASLLLESANTSVNIEAIRNLYERGEPEAAYDLIREAAGNGSAQQKQELANFLPQNSELMPYLRALQNPALYLSPGHAALQQGIGSNALTGPETDTRTAAYFVEYGYQTGVNNSEFNQTNHYYSDLANWIEAASATVPIAALCQRYCAGDIHACAITAFGVVGGYYKTIKFDSPMQTLIEQYRFVTSDRAVGMVLRRISFARPAAAGRNLLISDDELQSRSACLATAVAEVRARRN